MNRTEKARIERKAETAMRKAFAEEYEKQLLRKARREGVMKARRRSYGTLLKEKLYQHLTNTKLN